MSDREGIIVQITTERGITGIGEIAPLPVFGGGSLAEADSMLPLLAARLEDKTLDEALEWCSPGDKRVHRESLPVPLLYCAGWKSRCSMRLAKPRAVESVGYSLQLTLCHEQPSRSTP